MYSVEQVNATRERIIKDFSRHWEMNDDAHRIEHFLDVEKCGNYINDKLGLGFDPMLIMLVAFFHDKYAYDRHNHHLMSGEWVRSTDYIAILALSREQRIMVAAGCREHRASGNQPFTCDFAEMMCSADRGFPTTDPEQLVKRAVQHRMHESGMSEAEARPLAIEHIKEKYGKGGYARYPEMYVRAFAEEFYAQKEAIALL
jgi:hypothetical protein